MKNASCLLLAATVVWISGCGAPKPVANNNPVPNPNANKPSAPVVIGAPIPQPANPAENPGPTVNPAPATNADPQSHVEGKVAGVGVGKKGRYSRENVLGTIIATRWRVEEKLLFEAQIPQSMAVYKAQTVNGKGPKTHAEFMQKIIKENGYKLPELPPGERYEYDPATELLMVVSGEQ